MRTCVGLSVGATNLVAARSDGTSTVRAAAVAWGDTVLTGFVERVGDPVPIVAADGSVYSPDALLAAALTDLIRTAGRPGEGFGVAVPAHWPDRHAARVRELLPNVTVTSDAVASLTALRANPGLPTRGVVVLCDFGATGTSITFADAAADFRPIGATMRIDDFSGEMIDRTVMAHLLAASDVDPSATSAVQSLNAFRSECRIAKERLSFQAAVGLPGPKSGTAVRITRPELDGLLQDPLDRVLAALEELMWRNGIGRSDVVAVATVGGGSRIPLVTQCLSEFLRLPVTTTPRSQSIAAIGAALIAGYEPETMTRVALVPLAAQVPTMAAAAVVPHGEPAAAASSLAWSTGEPAAYVDDPRHARPEIAFVAEAPEESEGLPALRWFQRPAVLFATAACAAIVAGASLVVTADTENTSVASAGPAVVEASTPAAAPVNAGPAVQAPGPETVVVTQGASVVRVPQPRQGPVVAPQAPPAAASTASPATPAPSTTAPSTTAPATTTPTTTTTAPTTSTTAPTTTAPTTITPTTAPPTTATTSTPPPPPSSTTAPPTVTPTATAPVEPPPASAPPSSATVAPEVPADLPVLGQEG